MADPTSFTDEENWRGGFYELAMKLAPPAGPAADHRLLDAVTALWDDEALNGCYRDRWSDRGGLVAAPPNLEPLDHPASLYGLATLLSGATVVCLTTFVRFDGSDSEPAVDWIDLCLPTGSLGRVEPRVGGYPFEHEDTSQAWREPIDDWLATVARRVHQRAGIELGLLGFEVSGHDEAYQGGPPPSSDISFLVPSGDTLEHLKPTPWSRGDSAAG